MTQRGYTFQSICRQSMVIVINNVINLIFTQTIRIDRSPPVAVCREVSDIGLDVINLGRTIFKKR